METQGGVDGERLVGSFARQRTPAGVSMHACANGENRRQAENGTAQYYRRGEKSKEHLATYSTTAKINCMEELNKQCESMGWRGCCRTCHKLPHFVMSARQQLSL